MPPLLLVLSLSLLWGATCTNPPIRGTNPPIRGTNPPIRGTNPPIRGTNPPIRGVNLGGWLVLESYITPSLFALDTCTADPNVSSPCLPVPTYPVDQYTLTSLFPTPSSIQSYLTSHWSTFVTATDIAALAAANLTHVRIPIPHWILTPTLPDEPYAAGTPTAGEYPHLLRVIKLCREFGIQVWLDLHTAPGSQNGFDNSGHTLPTPTGVNWSGNPGYMDRTVGVVEDVCRQLVRDEVEDVVTGFGVLNEPFKGENSAQVRDYDERALRVVRAVLGKHVAVYIGDMFDASKFDDFWQTREYENTFLDSHYYHVFASPPRAFSPRQHVAYVCEHNRRDLEGCCSGSSGMGRIMGEWSASFDTLVCDKLDVVMDSFRETGVFGEHDRVIERKRAEFLKQFVMAQMVTWESAVSSGWFYWNFKMEGGAFAEWDYLRGVREGWIPTLPATQAAVDAFGTCESLIFTTNDDMDIVHTFPNPDKIKPDWQDVSADDDVVITHGDSLRASGDGGDGGYIEWRDIKDKGEWGGLLLLLLIVILTFITRSYCFAATTAYEPIPQ